MTLSERLYYLAESAVDVNNTLFLIVISVTISIIIGYFIKRFFFYHAYKDIIAQILSATTVQILLVIIFLIVRNNIQAVRLETLHSFFNNLDINVKPEPNIHCNIKTWHDGLEAIKRNPFEKGYYLITSELFVYHFADYESAAQTLEYCLAILKPESIPLDICEKLKIYYRELPNRPYLNKDCEKEIFVY